MVVIDFFPKYGVGRFLFFGRQRLGFGDFCDVVWVWSRMAWVFYSTTLLLLMARFQKSLTGRSFDWPCKGGSKLVELLAMCQYIQHEKYGCSKAAALGLDLPCSLCRWHTYRLGRLGQRWQHLQHLLLVPLQVQLRYFRTQVFYPSQFWPVGMLWRGTVD